MNIAEPGLDLGQPPGGYGPPGGPPGGWGPPGGPPGGGAPPGGWGPPPGAPPGGWGGGYGQPPPGGYGPPPGYTPYAPPGGQETRHPFSPADAITFAWERLKADPGTVLGTIILGFLLMGVVPFIGGIVRALAGVASAPTHYRGMAPSIMPFDTLFGGFVWGGFELLNFVVSSFFMAGLIGFSLKVARGVPYAFADLFGGAPFFLSVLAAHFIIAIAVAIGLVFLIVPGAILALGLWMTTTCIVDRKLGPIDALSESWRLTDGNKLNLFVFWLLSIGLSIAGMCACFIGIFLVMPLLLIAHAYIYLRLSGQPVAAVSGAAAFAMSAGGGYGGAPGG